MATSQTSPNAGTAARRRAMDAFRSPTPAAMVAGSSAIVLLGLLPPALRWIALPLVLWWPGRCLVAAIFGASRWLNPKGKALDPEASPADDPSPVAVAGVPPRVAMELLGSLIYWPILSLLIVWTGQRITQGTLSAALLLSACGLAALRRRQPRHKYASGGSVSTGAGGAGGRRYWLVPVLAVGAAVIIGVATVALVPRAEGPGFTQFSFAGNWALARGPVEVQPEHPVRVRFEVANHTDSPARYQVAATSLDATSGAVLARWTPMGFTLSPGERMTGEVDGAVPAAPCRQRLSLQLSSPSLPSTADLRVPDSTSPDSTSPDSQVPQELATWSPLTALVRVISEDCEES